MMKRIGLFLILLVLLGTIHVKAQYTVSYQYTKIVEANGIIKKGNPQSIYYFTFNQQVVYESDQYGNATGVGQNYAYFYVGRQGDTMIFENRSLMDNSNPFIKNTQQTAKQMSGIFHIKMLVSSDYSTLNICHYDANNQLVRTMVYNKVDPKKTGPAEIPELIR